MISGWVGDRSAGPVCVSLSWIGALSLIGRWFVDRSGSSWIRALVRGSELGFVDRSGSERCCLWFVDRSWIGAMFSLVRGSFVDRSDVRGSELSGSWIGVDRSSGFWVGARSFWFVDRSAVPGSELTVLGSDWVGALVAWIGASYLLRCVAVRGSTLCCCVCVGFLFRFSLLSVLLCVEM